MAEFRVAAKVTYRKPGKSDRRSQVESLVGAETREEAIAQFKAMYTAAGAVRFSRIECRSTSPAPRPPSRKNAVPSDTRGEPFTASR